MYPVSEDYKKAIANPDRVVRIRIRIEHDKGTLILTDKDIERGSFILTEATQPSDDFTIGGTYASNIEFTLINRFKYEDINFIGARIYPHVGVMISEGVDAHFIQPSQPSKYDGYEDVYEDVPLGVFNIDIADEARNTIRIKAIDNMIFLDKSYAISKLSYPATLYQIYVDICNIGDFGIGTTNFINKDYVVKNRPSNEYTLRNVLGFVAELSGSFAKFNRHGNLELKWYTPTDIVITPDIRSELIVKDFEVGITGVYFNLEQSDDNTIDYLAGTMDYAVDLSDNILLSDNVETVLSKILSKVKGVKFIPYHSVVNGDPSIQAGDIIINKDIENRLYKGVITNYVFKYRSAKCDIYGKALPNISRDFKSNDNRIPKILNLIRDEVGDRLSTLEEQQLQATELIANMLGGHAIMRDDALYIADDKDLSKAIRVWKWGLGGFGYSENGVDGPYTTAITADGSIVAMLITAGIITADMVQTGILQSEDGSSHINLDNGSVNFKNQFILSDDKLEINGPDIHGGNATFSGDGNARYEFRNGRAFRMMEGEDVVGQVQVYQYSDGTIDKLGGSFTARERDNERNATHYMPNLILNTRDLFRVKSTPGIELMGDTNIVGTLMVNGSEINSRMLNMQRTMDTLIIDSLEE